MRVDWTVGLLTAGLNGKEKILESGATFRTNHTMGHFGMSCQYWQPKYGLEYMHPGLNEYLTGVGRWWWDGSKECGRCLLINKTVVVAIADYCPECTPRQLDLNDKASKKLSRRNRPENYRDLHVKIVDCKWKGKVAGVWLDKGSNVYNWYVIPLYLRQPLARVRVGFINAVHDRYGRWVVSFKRGEGGRRWSVVGWYEDGVMVKLPLLN